MKTHVDWVGSPVERMADVYDDNLGPRVAERPVHDKVVELDVAVYVVTLMHELRKSQ